MIIMINNEIMISNEIISNKTVKSRVLKVVCCVMFRDLVAIDKITGKMLR